MHHLQKNIKLLIGASTVILALVGLSFFLDYKDGPSENGENFTTADAPVPLEEIENRVENGIHVSTGLIEGEGMHLVIAHCTACHSAKLVTQNRADRQGWKKMIRWMQDTQNLWDLGDSEPTILEYLSKNYAPKRTGRRPPLTDIEWYDLEN